MDRVQLRIVHIPVDAGMRYATKSRAHSALAPRLFSCVNEPDSETTMAARKPKRSPVRSFEREDRIRALIDARIIASADEIPADAIPARAEFIQRCRGSMSCYSRHPYFQAAEFVCTDCGERSTWSAEDQRHWYEQLRGSIYSTAARCQSCRRRRKGLPTKPGMP